MFLNELCLVTARHGRHVFQINYRNISDVQVGYVIIT
jgi:hypothetical protein